MEQTIEYSHTKQEYGENMAEKTKLSTYMTFDEAREIHDMEFIGVAKDSAKSKKLKTLYDFYLQLSEEVKDIEDFGPDRTPDYIVLKIIETYKKAKENERKVKTY